jgi:MFS family permease
MKRILPTIVLSQFFCTSLWFAGNAVMPDISKQFGLAPGYLVHLTSAVQIGFIIGTLVFAILNLSDRFSPSLVFFSCGIAAALTNLAVSLPQTGITALFVLRYCTGFFLAGIYPVGMKIASDHHRQGLGKSLGFLVGALVLGTAFPHFVKSLTSGLPWKYVIYTTSFASALGGLAMYLLVPDGTGRRAAQRLQPGAFLIGFRNPDFRAAAFGYFGHMWELYTFWVFVPVILSDYNDRFPVAHLNVPLLSFVIIGMGAISCALSGLLSDRFTPKTIAMTALGISCTCCILSPLFIFNPSLWLFLVFMLIWGLAVTADSPMFSTLVAQNVPAEAKGTALTIVNCIGFSITILSIQLLHAWKGPGNMGYIYMSLAIGPLLGLVALFRRRESRHLIT